MDACTASSHPLQDIRGLLQVPFGCLNQRDAVRCIAFSLLKTADLASHLLRYCQTCSIVAGAINTHARRELFDIALQLHSVELLLAVGEHRAKVVLDVVSPDFHVAARRGASYEDSSL